MHPVLLAVLGACAEEPPVAPTAPAPAEIARQPLEPAFPEGVDQIAHHADSIAWGPCPPGPLQGDACQLAVLEGDPKAPQLFTIRLKISEPIQIPAHSHPRNERVTVLEGAVHVNFGTEIDREKATRFEAGAYYVNRPDLPHVVWTEGPVIAQITGIGPWVSQPHEP